MDINERRAIRQRIMDRVERGMPRLIPVPMPLSVRGQHWFNASGIGDRLKVFALPLFQMGAFSGKLMPAFKLWLALEEEGKLNPGVKGLAPTSGNYGKDGAAASHAFDVGGLVAVVNHSLKGGKIVHLEAAGAEVIWAPENIPATEYARMLAEDPRYVLMDQYTRDESVSGHKWTMDHIAREMDRLLEEKAVASRDYTVAAVTGTHSTLLAAGRYLKRGFTDRRIKVMGVASMSRKEKIPGSRAPEDIAELEHIGGFPFQKEFEGVLDFDLVKDIPRHEVYSLNAELFKQFHLQAGPTSALNMMGVIRTVREAVEKGTVGDLMNEAGEIVIVLIWIDSYLAYIDDNDYRSYFR